MIRILILYDYTLNWNIKVIHAKKGDKGSLKILIDGNLRQSLAEVRPLEVSIHSFIRSSLFNEEI